MAEEPTTHRKLTNEMGDSIDIYLVLAGDKFVIADVVGPDSRSRVAMTRLEAEAFRDLLVEAL